MPTAILPTRNGVLINDTDTPETASTATPEKRGFKADAIRAYIGEHDGARDRDVIAALKEKGITVSGSNISAVRKALAKKAGGTTAKRKGGRPPKAKIETFGQETHGHAFTSATAFIQECGGIDNAIKILTLAKTISNGKVPF